MDCSCKQCRGACKHKPGWFAPGEAEKAAELYGMSMKQFFDKKLSVDWFERPSAERPDANTFVLSPSVVGGSPGAEFSANPRGRCVFYKNKQCEIHAAKPHECRQLIHTDTNPVFVARHAATADAWNEKAHQAGIAKLLGREPVAEEMDFFSGILGMVGL